jgi:acyl-CoA thioesterase
MHASGKDGPDDHLARRCAALILERDPTVARLGITLLDVANGRARLALRVGPEMLNSQGNCHGGTSFTLADVAFAVACSSTNRAGVGAHCAIDYLRPAKLGDVLTATATVSHQGSSASLVDVEVTDQDGRRIAQLRGRSHNFGRPLLADTGAAAAGGDAHTAAAQRPEPP